MDLLVIGDANPDVLVFGAPAAPAYGQAETLVDQGVLALGGSAAIVAHGAARLGLEVGLAAMVGRDAAGDFVLDALKSAGVDISACVRHESLPTALTVCLNQAGGDRAILTAPGCLAAFGPEHVPAVAARHVHAASYFLQPHLAAGLSEVFRTARAHGFTTSLDTNDDPSGEWKLPADLVEQCTFVLPNHAEAVALTGAADPLPVLAATGTIPVVKVGRDGCVALSGGERITVRPPVVEPVDTVGAGDSFDAGFLAGWLRDGDLRTALALGAAAGALSTRGAGGVATQPSWAEATAFVSTVEITSTQDA
ncbi:Sugar or nucleoside kinase, ribokinase family [Lentzea albidocapillata subsp. violacea]|uniref:Sugar or nucleoside kinase, ribokinase family n=1 Tax=Lentzea albidocapillata subsp. violacea TaxID=128104 RepID=A0A1G8YQZ0_9PSEU|nr:carbohydrate kinase family protein [Lentzea albidocapillata]SDK05203.1 Sugar or nucleoside kinase, ribokinase family [Lentzea albidocapillata subsp. violacea]